MVSTYDHKHSLLKIEYLSDALSELLYHCWQKKKNPLHSENWQH